MLNNKITFAKSNGVTIQSEEVPRGTFYLAKGWSIPASDIVVDSLGRALFFRDYSGRHIPVQTPEVGRTYTGKDGEGGGITLYFYTPVTLDIKVIIE